MKGAEPVTATDAVPSLIPLQELLVPEIFKTGAGAVPTV